MDSPIFSILDNLSLKDIESEAELIPLLTTEDEEALKKEALPDSPAYRRPRSPVNTSV